MRLGAAILLSGHNSQSSQTQPHHGAGGTIDQRADDELFGDWALFTLALASQFVVQLGVSNTLINGSLFNFKELGFKKRF